MRPWLARALLPALVGCGGLVPAPRGCTAIAVILTVDVVDATGAPMLGAVVTARNLATGKTTQATTDSQGEALFTEGGVDDGQVQLTADAGGRASDAATVTWTLDSAGCHRTPSPASVKLTVR